jgi:hypothetical protein
MTAVIPKDRVGVLVGPGGTVKSTIEEKLFVDLKIDSPSGAVEIGVKQHAPDPSGALQAKDIVLAIGRGFSPERAFRLFSEDNTLDIIDLHDFFGKNEAEIRRRQDPENSRRTDWDRHLRQRAHRVNNWRLRSSHHGERCFGEIDQRATAWDGLQVPKKTTTGDQKGESFRTLGGPSAHSKETMIKTDLADWTP